MKLFQDKPDKEVEQFWQGMEETLGTPVLAYALGQYFSGRDVEGPLWGLLYLTKDTLYFHHFAKRNWFSSLMETSGSIKRSETFTIEVKLDSSLRFEQDGQSGWRRFLQGTAVEMCRLVDSTGISHPFVFSVEQRDSLLLKELKRILTHRD